jgi:hypothetical protein
MFVAVHVQVPKVDLAGASGDLLSGSTSPTQQSNWNSVGKTWPEAPSCIEEWCGISMRVVARTFGRREEHWI